MSGVNGNGYYANCEKVDGVDVIRFHYGINETVPSTFTMELMTLYDAALVFSDGMANITENKSALLNSVSYTFDIIDDIFTIVRHSKSNIPELSAINRAYKIIQGGKEAVNNLIQTVSDCMTELRNTPIPEGKPTIPDIYNTIIEFVTTFQEDVEKIDGVIDETIKENVHNFVATVLQPMIDSAQLHEPYNKYHLCVDEKVIDVKARLKKLLQDLKDLAEDSVSVSFSKHTNKKLLVRN